MRAARPTEGRERGVSVRPPHVQGGGVRGPERRGVAEGDPATISEAEAEPPLISTMTGLFLARSPARALNRWVSSAVRPRVDTISPFSRNASETEIAWSSNPPGLLRKSMMKLLSLSPAWAERL